VRCIVLYAAFLTCIVAAGEGAAVAETYPAKAITIIVPYPPGGRTDLTARIVAQYLKDAVGQPVVVLNRGGAGGVAGAKEVATSKPDGYTLGFFSPGVVTAQYTVPTPTSLKDYELISIVNVDPAAMAVSTSAPWKTARELVAYAKKNPDQLKVGMIPGSSSQIFAAVFSKAAGIRVTFVPFKGDIDGAIALAGGHIDCHFAVPVSYKSLLDAGRVKVLGLAGEKREGIYKDFPTFKEQGIDVVIGSFHGVYAPKGTAKEIIEKLDKAIEKTMRRKEVQDAMNRAYILPVYYDRGKGAQFLAHQDAIFRKNIAELGLLVSKPR
jgi:tripartite-type tricarboxylate transporter receptor subunit TctC